jgi:hypothetical protein
MIERKIVGMASALATFQRVHFVMGLTSSASQSPPPPTRKASRPTACDKAGYTEFFHETSANLLQRNPGIPLGERAKRIESMWKDRQRTSIQSEVQPTSVPVAEYLGIRTVYHTTTQEAARSIFSQGRIGPRTSERPEAGISFADTLEQARLKTRSGANTVVVKAKVDFGTALVWDGPCPAMTLETLHSIGCDSVQVRSSQGAESEYLIYEPNRIKSVSPVDPGAEKSWDGFWERLIYIACTGWGIWNLFNPSRGRR